MSPDTYNWIKAAHVVGFLLWTGGLLACLQLLRSHHAAGDSARDALSSAERKTAVLADIGATIAIAAGFGLAFGVTPNAFKTGGWLHAKLTVVVIGLLVVHVVVRRSIRKFRQDGPKPVAGWLMPVFLATVVAIVALASGRPF